MDTNVPIYTWLDEDGRVNFSDRPDSENAMVVTLVWHSSGSLPEAVDTDDHEESDSEAYADETDEERQEREEDERVYCKQATEIYDTYIEAPQLYSTNEAGEQVFPSDEEAQSMLAEAKASVEEWCN